MNDIKNKVKAIIFDMDGTIVKTEHIWHNVVVDVLSAVGVKNLTPENRELIKSFSGTNLVTVCQTLKDEFNLSQSVQELIDRKVALAHEYFDKQLEFIDGFEAFHVKLQQHSINTSIATNADRLSLSKIAAKLKFEQFFGKNMYCVADVNFVPKPDPALFLHSASMLDAKPDECIVFEDSPVGFAAANAAGMKCIGIKNMYNLQHLDKVNHAIKDYYEAEEALKKVSK